MPTISVQQTPNGTEIEMPTFWYWMKAGIAFTLGAGLVSIVGSLAWLWLISRAPALVALKALAR